MLKIYCEHGAVTQRLRERQRAGEIKLVHFPYDPNSRSRHLAESTVPSAAQWRDMNVTWDEADFAWDDCEGSEHFQSICKIIGPANRRDILHVDSAFKSGCRCFVTADQDILAKRGDLERLLGVRFFHPKRDQAELDEFISTNAGGYKPGT